MESYIGAIVKNTANMNKIRSDGSNTAHAKVETSSTNAGKAVLEKVAGPVSSLAVVV